MNARSLCAAGLLAVAPVAAFAFETVDTLPWPAAGGFPAYPLEPVPEWGFSVDAGAMYDDNILRLPSATEGDTILRLGAGVHSTGLIYGRQRLLLDARAAYHSYARNNVLDHLAHAVRAEWLWELGNDLSGRLGYRRTHSLADPGETGRATKAMITDQRLFLLGAYRVLPDWRLTAGTELSDFSGDDRLTGEDVSFTVRAGIEYVSTLGNSIGLEARRTKGDAPVAEDVGIGAFPNNRFTATEYAGRLSYGLGTSLRIVGRLGRTEQRYTDLPGRDFEGTTYRGVVEWLPTAKTTLTFDVYKEPSPIIEADALYVLRQGVGFGPSWAPTIKLVFSARFIRERRQYQGDPRIEAGALLRDETLRLMRFGVGWEPQRNWRLGAAFDHGERESNTLGRDYEFNAVVLNLRYVY